MQKRGLLNLPSINGTSREDLSKIELVEAHGPKSLAVHLVTDRGQLTPGQNDFCIQFSNVYDGALIDVGQVEADFTREIGRIRGIRALARLTQTGVGHYCGQVNLDATGPWHVTVRYDGPLRQG